MAKAKGIRRPKQVFNYTGRLLPIYDKVEIDNYLMLLAATMQRDIDVLERDLDRYLTKEIRARIYTSIDLLTKYKSMLLTK